MGQGGYPRKAQSAGNRADRIQRAVRHHGRFKTLGAPSRQRFSRQHDCERQRRSRRTRYHSQGERELQECRYRNAGGKS